MEVRSGAKVVFFIIAPKAHFPSQAGVILCYDSSMAGVGPSVHES